jgi:hypothetical protein
MGARKLADDLGYPPRGMRANRAAAYLDMSPASFALWTKRRSPLACKLKAWWCGIASN